MTLCYLYSRKYFFIVWTSSKLWKLQKETNKTKFLNWVGILNFLIIISKTFPTNFNSSSRLSIQQRGIVVTTEGIMIDLECNQGSMCVVWLYTTIPKRPQYIKSWTKISISRMFEKWLHHESQICLHRGISDLETGNSLWRMSSENKIDWWWIGRPIHEILP